MQNRIPYEILSLLYLNGEVRIPGIGTLVQQHSEAEPRHHEKVIYPPQYTGGFYPEERKQGQLLEKYLAYRTGISRTEARRALHEFTATIHHRISAEGKVDFEALGVFTKIDGLIDFIPDARAVNPGATLHAVSLPPAAVLDIPVERPAARAAATVAPPVSAATMTPGTTTSKSVADTHPSPPIAQDESEDHGNGLAHADRRKRRVPFFIPLFVILFGAIVILAFLHYTAQKKRGAFADITQEHHEALITENATDVPYEAELTPVTADPETEESTATTAPDAPPTDTEPDVENVNNQTVETPDPSSTTEQPDQVEAGHQPEEVGVPKTGQCVVVVGAFAMPSNVQRMVQRLESMGYPVSQIPRGRLMQVGVPVDCDSVSAREVLSDLRHRVENSAWIFKAQ